MLTYMYEGLLHGHGSSQMYIRYDERGPDGSLTYTHSSRRAATLLTRVGMYGDFMIHFALHRAVLASLRRPVFICSEMDFESPTMLMVVWSWQYGSQVPLRPPQKVHLGALVI